MYRCNVCERVSSPRRPMKRHPVKREDGSILREVAACPDCFDLLELGMPLAVLRKRIGKARESILTKDAPAKVEYHPVAYMPVFLGRHVKVQKR